VNAIYRLRLCASLAYATGSVNVQKVKHEGERRSIFMRYLGEVATAVSGVNGMSRQELFDALVASAKRKTATADVLLGEDGMPMGEENFGENVIVVA